MILEERAKALLKIISSLLNYEPRLIDPDYKAAFDEVVDGIHAVEGDTYEDAAKISDEVGVDSEEGREIARRIRARAKEIK